MARALSALSLAATAALSASEAPAPYSLRGAANASEASSSLRSPGEYCSWEEGRNSDGQNLMQAPWSQDPQACCNHCGETQNCVAWTFIEGSHECWLKSYVPSTAPWRVDGSAISGLGRDPSPGAKKCLMQAPWSQNPQLCCNHCGETKHCVGWSSTKSSHECWLKSYVPSKDQWLSDSSVVSGTIGGPSSPCLKLSGTYCGGHGEQCDCNYCDDFCQDTPCARTCRVLNGFFSSPPHGASCWWSAASVNNPISAPDGTWCGWMEGNGKGGRGDDCSSCDESALKCRRANPAGNCRA